MKIEENILGIIESAGSFLDDDGKPKRTGTTWTASAHIITTVVGAGVLSIAWAMSQLGWIIGIFSILLFAIVNLFTSSLLADCYRSPDPVTGKRNHVYMDAVRNILGGKMPMICALIQYTNLLAAGVGYTITTALSMVTIRKINCFHQNGIGAACRFSTNPYMIGFGIVEIFVSQIPHFHKLSWLSVIAALTSFGYALIGSGLSLAIVFTGKGKSTSLMWGSNVQKPIHKFLNILIALGNLATANSYSQIVIDIQDSLKSSPPENKVMKKANKIGISTMTMLFLICGCSGYAAFGSDTPGNILLSSGFKEPFWLIDLANVFIVVHLVGAYQVVVQPIFTIVETCARQRWERSSFVNKEYPMSIGKMKLRLNLFRLVWRSIFVVVLTVMAMAMPFFNEMLALLGAIGFWPLTIYFPVEMYIARKNIKKGTKWFGLKTLSFSFLLLSLAIACAAIHGIDHALHQYKPFQYEA